MSCLALLRLSCVAQVMTKKIKHHQLLRYVNHYTSNLWAHRIILSLRSAGQKAREYNRLQKLDAGYLQVHSLSHSITLTAEYHDQVRKVE